MFSFGWQRDLPDFRDLTLESAKVKSILDKSVSVKVAKTTLPVSIDLRKWCSPVVDQGQLGSCFSPETIIPLLNGEKIKIKDLVGKGNFWVYSLNKNKEIVPGLACASLTGKNKKIMKIILDNDEQIKCTLDHKFMMRDSTFKEAKLLQKNDSVMPFKTCIDNKYLIGRELVLNPKDNRFHFVHRIVSETSNGKKKKGYVIHHKDFNILNNNPENLQLMTSTEHCSYHAKLAGWKWNGSEEQIEHASKNMKKLHEDYKEQFKEWQSKAGKKNYELHKDMVMLNFEKGRSKESRKKAAQTLIQVIKNRSEEKKKEISIKQSQRFVLYPELREISINTGKKLGGKKSLKFQILKIASSVLNDNKEINKFNWEEKRQQNIGRICYNTAYQFYDGKIDILKQEALTYNHKIKSVEFIDEISDVYCLSVKKYHNFAINAGVFVHNCTANAAAGLIEYFEKRAFNKFLNASRLFIYKTTRNLTGVVGDQGAYLRDTMKAMVMLGVPPETYWPYDIAKFDNEPQAFTYSLAQNYKSVTYYKLDPVGTSPANVLVNIKMQLAANLPSMFGFTVYSSISNSANIPYPSKGETVLGGHAICVVGFDDNKVVGTQKGALLIRNSWGTSWGDQGYGWLPYAYVLNGLAVDFWTLVQASFIDTDLFK